MKILVIGAAGFNLGDDAIAVTIAQRLADIIDDAEVTVACLNPGRLSRYGIKELPLNRSSISGWANLVSAVRHTDVVLLGGGTLIQDALGCGLYKGMIPYIWQASLLAKIYQRRLATVPIGIDDLKGQRAARLAGQILRWATPVLLRDERSLELAQQLGTYQTGKFVLSSDPVFDVRLSKRQHPVSEPSIVISYVRELREVSQVRDELMELITRIRAKWPSHKVVLLAMDTRESDERTVFRIVCENISDERVVIMSPSDYREVIHIIRSATLVVAMRLHVMIMALGHVPLVGISRTTKTDTLIKEASIIGAKIQSMEPNKLIDLMQRALADQERIAYQKMIATRNAERFSRTMIQLARSLGGICRDHEDAA